VNANAPGAASTAGPPSTTGTHGATAAVTEASRSRLSRQPVTSRVIASAWSRRRTSTRPTRPSRPTMPELSGWSTIVSTSAHGRNTGRPRRTISAPGAGPNVRPV
jgi:hypothetical protein